MPPSTADRIAEVALGLIALRGYAETSMEAVRREAGVSNGSLYHHFPSRADLAARLLLEGMTRCQVDATSALSCAADADTGVRAVVAGQLAFVQAHADLARLIYGGLPDEVIMAAEPSFSERNRAYVTAVAGWLQEQTRRGDIRDLPFGVAHALWLGPAQEFARHWLHGRSRITPTQASAQLGDGAWRALAAS